MKTHHTATLPIATTRADCDDVDHDAPAGRAVAEEAR
jgi:hypothetical protein